MTMITLQELNKEFEMKSSLSIDIYNAINVNGFNTVDKVKSHYADMENNSNLVCHLSYDTDVVNLIEELGLDGCDEATLIQMLNGQYEDKIELFWCKDDGIYALVISVEE